MKTILPISCKTLSINTLIVVLCLVIYSIGVSATVRYVKPIAMGLADGSSWDNAHPDIQTMINASAPGDSVWVAAGEYKPNSYPPECPDCTNSRFYTFYVKDGVRLFGNFFGTETDINQRDFGSNTTFLSGDLDGDDIVSGGFVELSITNNDENVFHVILISDTSNGNLPVTIDGFTIKGGNAKGTFNYVVNSDTVLISYGGGLYIQNQKTTITKCFILNNSASHGGGIISFAQNTIIIDNIIASNISKINGGGAFISNNTCTILNNSFIGNYAFDGGGGIYSYYSETLIINNEINGNTVGFSGGGVWLRGGTKTISNNTITNNYAGYEGGAIYNNQGTNAFMGNFIANNISEERGGGLFIFYGLNYIANNIFFNNTAIVSGGGIFFNYNINNVFNNTIVNNSSLGEGSGIYVYDGENKFTNNIFWNNKLNTESGLLSADLFLYDGSNTFQNNILQLDSTLYTGTNFSLGATAQGNLFAQDPMFLNIDNPQGEDLMYFTGDDGLRLQTNSPALNTGTLTDAPETDILGTPRDAIPDIGAYENGVFVGIQPNTNSNPTATLNAYPNPATEQITFTFTTPTTDHSTLLLYAIDGRNITSLYKGLTQAGETNTLIIDTNQFTPGTYCAVLRCGTGLAQHRTIIIK